MVEKILVEAIGGATAFYALAFSYYALRNAKLMRGPIGHRLMAAGAVLFAVTIGMGAAGELLGLDISVIVFSTWMVALLIVVAGGLSRVKAVTKIYKISILKALLMFQHVKYYLFSVLLLALVGIPFFLLDLFATPGYDWFRVGSACVWTASFVLLTVSERTLGMKAIVRMERVPHKLWRSDIQLMRARLDITNGYARGLATLAGMKPISKVLSDCANENKALLKDYKLEMPGKLAMKSLIDNLDNIPEARRDQVIFKTFCCIDAGFIVLYSKLTSLENTNAMLNDTFKEGLKAHGVIIHDYALPALIFGNVLEPILIKCKKETREAANAEIKKLLGKLDPLGKRLDIRDDGRIDLTLVYQSLATLEREERINRTISVFSAVQKTLMPILEKDIGPDVKVMIEKSYSRLKTDFPELKKFISKAKGGE